MVDIYYIYHNNGVISWFYLLTCQPHYTCQKPAKAATPRTLSPADWLLTNDEVTVAMNGFDRSKYVKIAPKWRREREEEEKDEKRREPLL